MKKKKIEQNRTRYRTIAFRMSDGERHELEKRIELSGLQKQDYLIRSVLHQKIVVIGNQIQFMKLNRQLDEIVTELRRIECAGAVHEELLAPIRTATEIINGFSND